MIPTWRVIRLTTTMSLSRRRMISSIRHDEGGWVDKVSLRTLKNEDGSSTCEGRVRALSQVKRRAGGGGAQKGVLNSIGRSCMRVSGLNIAYRWESLVSRGRASFFSFSTIGSVTKVKCNLSFSLWLRKPGKEYKWQKTDCR